MTNLRGTNIAAGIVPFTDSDQFASHYARYGQGGWRSVDTLEDLDLIADDRLEKGMAVYVTSEEKVFILTDIDSSTTPVEKTWTELETGGNTIQVETLPTPTSVIEGTIVEYIGETETGEPEAVVAFINTTNPCEVTIDQENFETMLASFTGHTVEELENLSVELRFRYASNKWWLYNNQIGTTSDLEHEWGITLDYGAGSETRNDKFYIDWLGNRDPYIVNGYFYQVGSQTVEDDYSGFPVEYTNEFEVEADIYTYRQYIEDQGRLLVDAVYEFTYDGSRWLRDNITPTTLSDYGLSVIYHEGEPREGDSFVAVYNAEYNQYTWLQKDVQNVSNKIDKFKQFPNATEENEGLIAQYVGETVIDDSYYIVQHVQSIGADLTVDLDKDTFEQLLVSTYGEESIAHPYECLLNWDSHSQKWNYETTNEDSGGEITGVLSTAELELFGVFITASPRIEDLEEAFITLNYTPVREGNYHNGYFYKSVEKVIPEDMNIYNLNNLELDDDNPYELDIETYKAYVEGQGQELDNKEIRFRYGRVASDESSAEEVQGWYDSWNGPWDPETGLPVEADLENDYGVTLHYKELETNVQRNAVYLSLYSTNAPRLSISKIDADALITGLINKRVIESEPTKPTSFYFQSYGNNSYRVNGVDVGQISGLLNDFGIYLDEIYYRAPLFEYSDYFTVYFTPEISLDTQTSSYLLVDGHFNNPDSNAHGGYVGTLDIDTFEQELVPNPTNVTYYKWECTTGGDNSTSVWSMSEIYPNQVSYGTCDPADYGITLVGTLSRAPQTPFIEGDTFTVMYRPSSKDVYRVSKEYWDNNLGFQGTNIVSETTFKNNFYDNDGVIRKVTLVCSDEGNGVLSDTRWADSYSGYEYTYQELETKFGITLTQARAAAYNRGDFFEVEFIPTVYNETILPTDSSEFSWKYQKTWRGRLWEQVDVQPKDSTGTIDYNELENRPAIDGVVLTSETTARNLSGSFVDLTSDQTANGTKIINELFRAGEETFEAKDVYMFTPNLSFGCSCFVPRDDNTVFAFGAISAEDVGTTSLYGQDEKAYPAFGIIRKINGELIDGKMYPLNPDLDYIASIYGRTYGYSTVDILGGFWSNVEVWYDSQDNNKKYFFALTSPCILSKIDPDYLTPDDYRRAVVNSWYIGSYDNLRNKINLNRIRVQGDNIYIFQEMDNGNVGGLYPTKFDIRNPYCQQLGYASTWSAGGYYSDVARRGSWGYYPSSETGHDYQIITKNNIDYCYLFADIKADSSNPFYDINNNAVEYPFGTIYKFPLDNSASGDNLQYLGYQFNSDLSGKCEIRNILKIDERYLLVTTWYEAECAMYFNLFDTSIDSVVSSVKDKIPKLNDDYSIYKQDESHYIVSGVADELLYRITIDTNNGRILEDDYSITYPNAYYDMMPYATVYTSPNSTIFVWDNNLQQTTGDYYMFNSPLLYTNRETAGGDKDYFVWIGSNVDLDRYATESYVDNMISTANYVTEQYLSDNGYATQSWCNGYNINYNYLAQPPFINGVQVYGNKTSQDYRIIDAYGINITSTQMLMNNKGIVYETPFQVSTVFAGSSSEYDEFNILYIIPSKTENNVYYQVVNTIPTGYSTNYRQLNIFKFNSATGDRTAIYGMQETGISGTYNSNTDTLSIVAFNNNSTYTNVRVIRNLSDESSRRFDFTGMYTSYGNQTELEGLFADNIVSDNYTQSGVIDNASFFIRNTTNNRLYRCQVEILDNGFLFKNCGWTSISAKDFKDLKNNIVRHNVSGNYDGQAFIFGYKIADNVKTYNTGNNYSNVFISAYNPANNTLSCIARCSEGIVFEYDGTNWTRYTNAVPLYYNDPSALVYYTDHIITDTGFHVAVATRSSSAPYDLFTTSSDGINWSSLSTFSCIDSNSNGYVGMVYINGTYYLLRSDAKIYESTDLVNWDYCTTHNFLGTTESICTDGEKLYVLDKYGFTLSTTYQYTIRICVYDPATDTWEDRKGSDYLTSSYLSYKLALKCTGKQFYIFEYSQNGNLGFTFMAEYYASKDCWSWDPLNLQSTGNYFNHYYDYEVESSQSYYQVMPTGIATDGQGGWYAFNGSQIRTNTYGVFYNSNKNGFMSSRIETDIQSYDATNSIYRNSSYSEFRYDTTQTTLLNNPKCVGTVGCGTIYYRLPSNNVIYDYTMPNTLLQSGNKVYLAPSYGNTGTIRPDSSSNTYYLTPGKFAPFIFMIDDNHAMAYIKSSSGASDISELNGYGRFNTNQYISIYPNNSINYNQFKQLFFRVMPTYRILSVSIQNSGSGYQVGDIITLQPSNRDRIDTPNSNYASVQVTAVDANGGITQVSMYDNGVYNTNPNRVATSDWGTFDGQGSGSGLQILINSSEIIRGSHNGGWLFGDLTVNLTDMITPDLDNDRQWKLVHTYITDDDLVELKGSFEDEGGIYEMMAIDTRPVSTTSTSDLSKFYFYCLIRTNEGTVKAYKSQEISQFRNYSEIRLTECSTDLTEATSGTEYSVSYLANYAFVYSPDNFYVTTPAYVNFKGKITDLYDTKLMEIYTTHPKTGFMVPALDNKKFRNVFTKSSDFDRYYYKFDNVHQYGSGWTAGVHQVDAVFHTNDGDIDTTVLFEIDINGSLKQVFSVSLETGKAALSNNYLTLINPDDPQADDIVLEFETVDLNSTSFIPSVEKYGITKRGYQVENTVANNAQDTDKIPSVKGMVDYVSQHSGGGSTSSTQVTLVGGANNWSQNEQTVNATGVTEHNTVMVAPSPACTSDYTSAGILCTTQGNGTLTFTCTTVPSNSIIVNVVIIG